MQYAVSEVSVCHFLTVINNKTNSDYVLELCNVLEGDALARGRKEHGFNNTKTSSKFYSRNTRLFNLSITPHKRASETHVEWLMNGTAWIMCSRSVCRFSVIAYVIDFTQSACNTGLYRYKSMDINFR